MGETANLDANPHAPIPYIGPNGEPVGPASASNPPDDDAADQDPDYEEAENLDPDTSLGDPEVER